MHLKSVLFERDNLQMELDEALNQIEKLEEQVQVAVKAGGDEVLHTVMEIRQNPYEDDFDIAGVLGKDNTVELDSSPLEDKVEMSGRIPKPKMPPFGTGQQASTSIEQGNFKMALGLHNKKF